MEHVVVYLEQKHIDLIQELLGRKLTWQEKAPMYQRTTTSSLHQAERLVEHFRLTGHIAFIEENSQE